MRRSKLTKIWQVWQEETTPNSALREPFPYRVWKWLWQKLPVRSRERDLFDRLETTEWDVLVLLDACRYDVLADVATNAVIGRTHSPASATPEFLSLARERGVFDGAIYVSGNPQSIEHSPGDVEHVSAFEDHWDEELSTVPPDPLFRIAKERLGEGSKVVIHTLQPHYPHICRIAGEACPVPGGLHPRYFEERLRNEKLQALLANGYINLDRAQQSYEQSVRFAWDRAAEFAATLAQKNHRTVVSADHGELFGEWGFVEHPVGLPLSPVLEVPWVVFEPPDEPEGSADVDDRLAALGYVES